MSSAKPVDNYKTTLRTAHAIGDGTLALALGTGAALGSLTGGQIFRVVALLNPDTTIETVISEFDCTGITTDDLTGATASLGYSDVALSVGAAIQIRFTSNDMKDLQSAIGANTTAITGKQDTSLKLSAIDALTWAADKVIYLTGAATVALTSLTSYMRGLLGSADAAAARTTLGLGSASTHPATDFDAAGAASAVTKTSIGLGSVENTALSTWHGSLTLDTLGTITAATWQGTAIVDAYIASSATWNSKATAAQGSKADSAVQSISLTTPGLIYTSPVTWSVSSGAASATLALATQTANVVFSGPSSGSASTPTFRALVAADIPSLDAAQVASGTIATARLGSGTASATTFLRGDQAYAVPSATVASGTSGRVPYETTGGVLTDSANLTYISGVLAAFGPSVAAPFNGGPLQCRNSTTTTKLINFGVDTSVGTYGYGWLQVVNDGVATMPLILQPGGGSVGLGTNNPGAIFDVRTNSTYPLTWGSTSAQIGALVYSGTAATLVGFTGDIALLPLGTEVFRVSTSGQAALIASPAGTVQGLVVRGATSQTAPLQALQGISSTSTARDLGYLDAGFTVSTDASYRGYVRLCAQDFNATSGGREGVRVGTSGTAATLGFYGATPVVKAAAPTTLADVIALLQALGLCS